MSIFFRKTPTGRTMLRSKAALVGLAVVTGCLMAPSSPTLATGWWVFHIAGDRYVDHIQLLRIDEGAGRDWPLGMIEAPSLDGAGQPVVDLDGATMRGRVSAEHRVEWEIVRRPGDVARMTYDVIGDTALGTFSMRDSSGSDQQYPAWGVRIDPSVLEDGLRTVAANQPDSTPVVLLRLDDAFVTDRLFIPRLRTRSLVAELAIPTAWVGRPDRISWNELHSWALEGFSVVAHSRWHRNLTTGHNGPGFVSEVVGSLTDLRRQGFPTRVFVQPGPWRDSLYFNGSRKMNTWRGALLRTFADVLEAYAYSGSVARLQDAMAMGMGHVTISNGATRDDILTAWGLARQPGRFTVFLVHSFAIPSPDALDWFLDSLAAAKAAGAIHVVGSSEAMFVSARLSCPSCSALGVTSVP